MVFAVPNIQPLMNSRVSGVVAFENTLITSGLSSFKVRKKFKFKLFYRYLKKNEKI